MRQRWALSKSGDESNRGSGRGRKSEDESLHALESMIYMCSPTSSRTVRCPRVTQSVGNDDAARRSGREHGSSVVVSAPAAVGGFGGTPTG